MDEPLRIFIGWDQREDDAYRICLSSIVRRASQAVHITPIKLSWVQKLGIYTRGWTLDEQGNRIDTGDRRPFSTDFAFTRFLVPHLSGYRGTALFCDCDFLFQADVAELFALQDDRYAVQVVKHDHRPTETVKMDGQVQQVYPRKNWSSLILWNNAHRSHMALTPQMVSEKPGSFLHGFGWLKDEEIGELPVEWNWLEGWSSPAIKPKAVHHTRGGPWMPSWQDVAYAKEWQNERSVIQNSRVTQGDMQFGNPFNIMPKPLPLMQAADD